MEAIISVKGIKKYFSETKALDWDPEDKIDFYPGEIHALVGENGAGKSTLVQILTGIYRPDAGEMILGHDPYSPASLLEAEKHGISIIMQAPNILPNLTVAENIFIGRDSEFATFGFSKKRLQRAKAQELLRELKYSKISPDDMLRDLNFEDNKLVEIARALSIHPKILVVDETSAAVSRLSAEKLYEVLRQQRNAGVAIIYISHFIEEIFELSDKISILRDGKLIKTKNTRAANREEIITNMVGREIKVKDGFYRSDNGTDMYEKKKVLEVEGLNKKGAFEDITFDVRQGEIVGIGGIGGCGFIELGGAIFGAIKDKSGTIKIDGEPRNIQAPTDGIQARISYIPKDRDLQGLYLSFPIRENITSIFLKEHFARKGFIKFAQEKKYASERKELLKIKANSIEDKVLNLSGGNRQKVAIARWLSTDSRILIFNSPTRGVDVMAKQEIYRAIDVLRLQGKAIILISDDMLELIGMCDRIFTMRNGRITKEFNRKNGFAEEALMEMMV